VRLIERKERLTRVEKEKERVKEKKKIEPEK